MDDLENIILSEVRLPRWSSGRQSTCQYRRNRRHRFNPWVGRSPEGENGNPFQYSCLENFMDRGAWRATVHGVTESWYRWAPCTRTHMKYVKQRKTNMLSLICRRYKIIQWIYIQNRKRLRDIEKNLRLPKGEKEDSRRDKLGVSD